MSLTSAEIMDEAALLLNDSAKVTFTYTVQAPWLKRAVNQLTDELSVNSIPLLTKVSVITPISKGSSTIALPSDSLLPISLEERALGSSDSFIPMIGLDSVNTDSSPQNSLRFWAFQGNISGSVLVLDTPSASSDREVRITYQRFLTYAGIDGSTDFGNSLTYQCKGFLASKVAEFISRFVISSQSRSSELKNESALCLNRLIAIWVKFKQRNPIRHSRYSHPTQVDAVNLPTISGGTSGSPVTPACPDPYVNIKCSPYNAVGDGLADDTGAIKAAIAALEALGGGILFIPPGKYLITDTLTFTKPSRVLGAGLQSKLVYSASFSNLKDAIKLAPALGGGDFSLGNGSLVEFSNFVMFSGSGTSGRHGIAIDLSEVGASIYVRLLSINKMWIGQFSGRAIALINGTAVSPIHGDGLFCSNIENNILIGGVQLVAGGDSINILKNTITGNNPGVEYDAVSGAAQIVIAQNNITSSGGAVWIKSGYCITIANNQIEQVAAYTGSVAAMVDIDGPATGVIIQNNTIGASFAPLNINCIRLNNSSGAIVEGNVLRPPLNFYGVAITANQSDSLIRRNNYNLSLGGGEFTLAPGVITYTNLNERSYNPDVFAAAYTPDTSKGEIVELALTGNITIGVPVNAFIGRKLIFLFTQDATGGRTVTWNAVFLHSWSDTGNTANKRSSIMFVFNGNNYVQVGAQRTWA